VALQRQRRKRDRGKSEDDERVIRLEDQQHGDRGEDDEQGRDQEDRRQDEDEEPRQQEEGSQAEDDQGREAEDREPSSSDESRDRDEEDDDKDREDRRSEPLPALEILDAAKDQLTVLTGRIPDSVSGLRRSDNGWRMRIDMVELERIPPSTSVMATYEVELDRDGNVIGYEQERRFVRGQADD
jgi:Gas vesicle synthesis protein GvpO